MGAGCLSVPWHLRGMDQNGLCRHLRNFRGNLGNMMYSSNRTRVIFSRLTSLVGVQSKLWFAGTPFRTRSSAEHSSRLRRLNHAISLLSTLPYHIENIHKEWDRFLHERAFGIWFPILGIIRTSLLRFATAQPLAICSFALSCLYYFTTLHGL